MDKTKKSQAIRKKIGYRTLVVLYIETKHEFL